MATLQCISGVISPTGNKEALCDGSGIPHADLAYHARTLDTLRSSKTFGRIWLWDWVQIGWGASAVPKLVLGNHRN
jgi:hypothetical protein